MDINRSGFELSCRSLGDTKLSDHESRIKSQPTSGVWQLGSSPKIIGQGKIDMRLLSFIVPPEKMPRSFKPILYALVRDDVVSRRKRFWASLADNYLVLVNSIEGRGQNNVIRAENALKGLPVQIEVQPERPSVLDRVFDQEKVKAYKDWEDRQELGLE